MKWCTCKVHDFCYFQGKKESEKLKYSTLSGFDNTFIWVILLKKKKKKNSGLFRKILV